MNSYDSSINCRFRRERSNYNEPSAVACYLSRSINQLNAGVGCCYDGIGQLITRGTDGGTDDRYQLVSSLVLHFFSDTLLFLACRILNSKEQTCASYFHLRPHH
ncbi:unnamed protein product [Rotaria sp. Silwood1]|nr:unnamed protein product [Rotaria sp. Silwood1]CAF4614691.1 unnamed protein product [Rotaria sp. Silwood1]